MTERRLLTSSRVIRSDLNPAEDLRARRAAAAQWQRTPAGTPLASAEEGTPEFFKEMSETRYAQQPWHRQLLRGFAPTGRLLEIGTGAGTDHAVLASMASGTVGIDLAHKGASLTARRLELEGRPARTAVADGEHLPFRDNSFDEIYSFGVIHHTDHPEQVAEEMYRVLRPEGRFLVALYNRWSTFTASKLASYILDGDWRNERWGPYFAKIEAGAELFEPEERPLVRLYTRRGARHLFSRFEDVQIRTMHAAVPPVLLERRVFAPFRLLEHALVEERLGWYHVIVGSRGK